MEIFAAIVTNLIKLGGLVVALNEVLTHDQIRTPAIAIAALMMAGAVSLEGFFRNFLGANNKKEDEK